MGKLCCYGFLISPPMIVNSNKWQSVSRSSIFIGSDSLSRPIASSMWWLVEACVRILFFGVGGKFLSAFSARLINMVDLSASTSLSRVCNLCWLQLS